MKISKLTLFIFLSLFLGIFVGWISPEFGLKMHPLAVLFLNMIKMIVAPLLFSVIVTGIAAHAGIRAFGKLGVKTFVYFIFAALLALVIGLTVGLIFEPGRGFDIAPSQNSIDDLSSMISEDMNSNDNNLFLDIIPTSIVKAMAEGNLLQIVIFSIFFAFAICSAGEKAKPVLDFIKSLSEIMFKFTQLVMNFAPIGIFGAVSYTIAENGMGIIASYAKIIGSLYFALILFLVIILNIVCRIAKISVFSFIRAIKEPIILAFTTSTSEAALPQAMKIMKNYGVPENIVGFVMPTGYTFNLDGSTLYLSLAMLFSFQIADIHISVVELIVVMFTLMVTSKGVAGVPRAALVVLAATLSNFDYPLIGVAVLLGIDHILDMGRTTVNLIGNCIATVLIAKWENEFNYDKLKEFDKQFITQKT